MKKAAGVPQGSILARFYTVYILSRDKVTIDGIWISNGFIEILQIRDYK
jgi:hypothetical protein